MFFNRIIFGGAAMFVASKIINCLTIPEMDSGFKN
jgi:hypothetical protein